MWYSATGTSPAHAKWSIGLATASDPLRPWTKFEGKSGPGQTVQTTFPLKLESRFAKILVENRDPAESLTDLSVAAKLSASD